MGPEKQKIEYRTAAIKAINGMSHYYGSLKKDAVAYLKHYFPNAKESDLGEAMEWAISVVFVNECDIEIE